MTSEDILRDHSESAVREAIEENHIVFYVEDFGRIPEPHAPHIYRGGDMMRYFTGIPEPFLNIVYAFQFDEQTVENRVREAVEYFRSRNVPHMWWFGARSSPEGIGELLVEQGLIKSEWESPAMAVDLRQLDESKLQELTERSGVELRRVTTEEDLDRWMEILNITFEADEPFSNGLKSVYRTLLDREDSHIILAEIDGEPVGISSSVLRAGVVGLFCVGTLKEHQGKGIGSLVSLAAILEGRKQGYEISILSSSKPGFNVYPKLGFKEYFRYRFYVDMLQ